VRILTVRIIVATSAEKRLQDLERLSMMQEDSWAARMRAEEQNKSNQNVR